MASKSRLSPKKRELPWAYAVKSFMGYLEGTGKSLNTIQSYRSDLAAFELFLKATAKGPIRLNRLEPTVVKEYLEHLKAERQRPNTRRRKVLTADRFLRYLVGRNRLAPELGRKLPAPYKVERVPSVVSPSRLLECVAELAIDNPLQRRNRVLLSALAFTGCSVSEAARLNFGDFSLQNGVGTVELGVRERRQVPVPASVIAELRELQASLGAPDTAPAFTGFNRFGPLAGRITPRGVEILVKAHRARFGMPKLTPRAFRHAAVLRWHGDGLSRDEIRRRLGLKTEYAFRVFAPLFTLANPGASG